MSFETIKTMFTVFSLNRELYSSVKSVFNMKLESESAQMYTYENRGGELCATQLHPSRFKISCAYACAYLTPVPLVIKQQ